MLRASCNLRCNLGLATMRCKWLCITSLWVKDLSNSHLLVNVLLPLIFSVDVSLSAWMLLTIVEIDNKNLPADKKTNVENLYENKYQCCNLELASLLASLKAYWMYFRWASFLSYRLHQESASYGMTRTMGRTFQTICHLSPLRTHFSICCGEEIHVFFLLSFEVQCGSDSKDRMRDPIASITWNQEYFNLLMSYIDWKLINQKGQNRTQGRAISIELSWFTVTLVLPFPSIHFLFCLSTSPLLREQSYKKMYALFNICFQENVVKRL